MAPQAGIGPTTRRASTYRSTIELPRHIGDLKHPLALLEPQMGLEPTSNGLEDRGSSIELLRRS